MACLPLDTALNFVCSLTPTCCSTTRCGQRRERGTACSRLRRTISCASWGCGHRTDALRSFADRAYDHPVAGRDETQRVLRGYADAWLSSDLERVLASYHDDIELHYMGMSPLAGTHRGRDAAFTALGQASVRTQRKLIAVEDVLVGDSLGALIAVEDLGDPPQRVRRVLLYRVQDGKLRECWLFDEDQRFVDDLWSREG